MSNHASGCTCQLCAPVLESAGPSAIQSVRPSAMPVQWVLLIKQGNKFLATKVGNNLPGALLLCGQTGPEVIKKTLTEVGLDEDTQVDLYWTEVDPTIETLLVFWSVKVSDSWTPDAGYQFMGAGELKLGPRQAVRSYLLGLDPGRPGC